MSVGPHDCTFGNWFELVHANEMAELNQRTTEVNMVRRVSAEILADGFQGDYHVYQQTLNSMQLHFDRFAAAHDILVGGAADASELTAHQTLWDEMEALYNRSLIQLNRLMAAIVPEASVQGSVPEDNESTHAMQMSLKLDPVGVPKFDGSLRNWLAFKDAFQTIIDKPEIPEYYKLQKLRDSLVGESLKTLIGNLYTGGFRATWDELVKRYDPKKPLAELHVSRFVGIKPITSETGTGLLTIVDTVRESLRALRVMELPVDQWDALSVPIVTSKLPQVTQQAWGMHTSQEDIPKLDDLLSFVEKRAQSLSLDILHWPGTSNGGAAGGSTRRVAPSAATNTPNRLVKSNLTATTPGNCGYCNENTHRIGKCPVLWALPVAERFTKLKGSDLCFNSLRPGHSTKTCSGGACRNCQGKHHTMLCRRSSTSVAPTTISTPTSTTTEATTSTALVPSSRPPHNHTA